MAKDKLNRQGAKGSRIHDPPQEVFYSMIRLGVVLKARLFSDLRKLWEVGERRHFGQTFLRAVRHNQKTADGRSGTMQFEPQRREDAKVAEPSSRHNAVSRLIVDAAYVVHTALGAGLLESVYEQCLALELKSRDLTVESQVGLPICYRGVRIDGGFRLDLLVQKLVVVEIKAVERLLPVHDAQLLTYLKLSGHRLGLLINFNVVRIKDGLRRFVNS